MCVVSGSVCKSAYCGRWTGFEAAHIIPQAFEGLFMTTDLSYVSKAPGGNFGINSPQNGLLLRADIHKMFDQYLFSVNPLVSVDLCREININGCRTTKSSVFSQTRRTSTAGFWRTYVGIRDVTTKFPICSFGGIFGKVFWQMYEGTESLYLKTTSRPERISCGKYGKDPCRPSVWNMSLHHGFIHRTSSLALLAMGLTHQRARVTQSVRSASRHGQIDFNYAMIKSLAYAESYH